MDTHDQTAQQLIGTTADHNRRIKLSFITNTQNKDENAPITTNQSV